MAASQNSGAMSGTKTVSDRCSRPQDPDLFQTSCCSDFRYTNFCDDTVHIALNFVHPDNKVAENTESRVAQKRVAENQVAESKSSSK